MFASFTWVGIFSMLIIVITSRWVEMSGVDAGFFGVTCVALGGQVPDALQSIAVARKGWGSMAVANAIGSQNMNILIGLGCPWLIVCILGGEIRFPATRIVTAAAVLLLSHVILFTSMTLGVAILRGRPKMVLLTPRGGTTLIAFYVISVMILLVIVWRD
jgi:Ca2+/Na+ antiporter